MALVVILAVILAGIEYMLIGHPDAPKKAWNNTAILNTTTKLNNTTVKDTATEESESESAGSQNSESGQYGYCAICGRALTYSEANHEITQGKVCIDCANNPDYQTGEGADYANRKLYEAYPDEYEWMYENDATDKNNR
jgi:hypothetical protein